jgi:hypothetical protein
MQDKHACNNVTITQSQLDNLDGTKTNQKTGDSTRAVGGTDVMSTMALAKSWSNRRRQEKGKLMKGIDITKLVCGIAAGVMLATPQAKAGLTETFTLNNGNTGLGGDPGPFGTVTVTWVDSTHATVTLTGNTVVSGANTYVYSFGDGGTIGLNLNAALVNKIADVTLTGLSLTDAGHSSTPPSFKDVASGNEDGFGNFNFQIDLNAGWGSAASKLSFGLTLNQGTWASVSDILNLNNKNFDVAAHVFPTLNGADQGLSTGFAATPEPTTMIAGALLLLPFGASTLKIVRRKKAE